METPLPQQRVSVDSLSNHDLILMAQVGARPDRAALTEIMKRYRSHVDRLLYHLAPDWQDRADLSQEVWIRVYRNIKNLNEPEKFRGWLSRIATNLFYDELRKRKRNSSPLSLDAPILLDGSELMAPAPKTIWQLGSSMNSYEWRSPIYPMLSDRL
jgi:DNA-directed RNA polymerase specialized sigma24 family protein